MRDVKLSSGREKKSRIRELLLKRDLKSILLWAEKDRTPFKTMTSLLFDSNPLVCWRAIEATGEVAALVSQKDIKGVRRQLQRFLWLMNDESGGICWYAPEAIGEVIYNVSDLTQEYGLILLSFLNEEPFEGGVRWAMARLASRKDLSGILHNAFIELIPALDESLKSGSAKIRGNALLALKALNAERSADNIKSLVDDTESFNIYDFDSGRLNSIKIGDLAARILKNLKK